MNLDLITVKKFSELSGYSQDAIYSKIKRGDWTKEKVWFKAPDGRTLISIKGFVAWVLGYF